MTLEIKLTTILKAICPRVYTDFADTNTERPYVTFQQIGGTVIPTLANQVASKENAEVQVNVWSDSRVEAKAMIKQIEAALVAAETFQARPIAAPGSDFEADMRRYCSRQDFTIWTDR